MKKSLSLILGGTFFLAQVTSGLAATLQTNTLTVSATIPSATGVSLTVSPINATTNAWGTGTVISGNNSAGAINFGNLTYNATSGIYTPANYFAVDISAAGGAGTPTVQVTYAEGTNPNNVSTNGLGTKATATFVTTSGSGSNTSDAATSIGKQRLIDLTGSIGTLTSIPSGSWERVYVGVWTGAAANGSIPADPSSGKPFNNTDASGTYTGTLTFTTTAF